jgi:hypothetical protein
VGSRRFANRLASTQSMHDVTNLRDRLSVFPEIPTCTIFFGTAGGEHCVLESEDGEYVFRVAEAVDEALVAGV